MSDRRIDPYDPLGRYAIADQKYHLMEVKLKELDGLIKSEKRKFMQEFVLNCARNGRVNEGRSLSGVHMAVEANKAWDTMMEILTKKEEEKHE